MANDSAFIYPEDFVSPPGTDDTYAIQSAISAISKNFKGKVVLRKRYTVSQSLVIPKDRDIAIEGYGAEIICTQPNIAVLVSDVNSITDTNTALLYKTTIKGLTITGPGDGGSIGIDLRGTYGSLIESCHFKSLGTGFRGTFCLNTQINHCLVTLCNKDAFILRSAAGIWPGANNNNSQSNCSVIWNCRVYGSPGMLSHYKFYSSSECRVVDSISEGFNPINCIVHNTLSQPNHDYRQHIITAGANPVNSGSITIEGETTGIFTNITNASDFTAIANQIKQLPKYIQGQYNVIQENTAIRIYAPTRNISVMLNGDAFIDNVILENGGTGYLATTVTNFVADNIHIECSPTDAVYWLGAYGLSTISKNYYVYGSPFTNTVYYDASGTIKIEDNYYVVAYTFKNGKAQFIFKGFGNTGGNILALTSPGRWIGTMPNSFITENDSIEGKIINRLIVTQAFQAPAMANTALLTANNPIRLQDLPAINAAPKGVRLEFSGSYFPLKDENKMLTDGYHKAFPILKSISENDDQRDSIILTANTGDKIDLSFEVQFNNSVKTIVPRYTLI